MEFQILTSLLNSVLDRTTVEQNSTFGFRLAKTLEVPNTIMVGNSLSFPIVHNTASNGRQFMSYSYRNLDRSAVTEFWADSTFRHKSGI
jgi:hypothetical protein